MRVLTTASASAEKFDLYLQLLTMAERYQGLCALSLVFSSQLHSQVLAGANLVLFISILSTDCF